MTRNVVPSTVAATDYAEVYDRDCPECHGHCRLKKWHAIRGGVSLTVRCTQGHTYSVIHRNDPVTGNLNTEVKRLDAEPGWVADAVARITPDYVRRLELPSSVVQ